MRCINQAAELGREPTVDGFFVRSHTGKKDSFWVDPRSKNNYDTFQKKLHQASQGANESGSQIIQVESVYQRGFFPRHEAVGIPWVNYIYLW